MSTIDLVQQYADEKANNSSLDSQAIGQESTLDVLGEFLSSQKQDETVEQTTDAGNATVESDAPSNVEDLEPTDPNVSIEVNVGDETTETETSTTDEDYVEEDDFISAKTNGQFKSWEELEQALEQQQQAEVQFENEFSQKVYEMIAEGKVDELADVLYTRKVANEIKTKSDEEVLKAYIKQQNPEFDGDDVEAEYAEKYTIDEYAFDESKLKREQKKLSQRIKSDVDSAKQFFENMSADIKFPELAGNQQVDDNSEFEAEAQVERQKFLDSLKSTQVDPLSFQWKDDKANISVSGKYEIPAQDLNKYRNSAENIQEYLAERYYKDGQYQSDKLLKEMYVNDNFDKIIQTVISQTANQTRLEMLKQKKNITTDVEQSGTYRPSTADEERNLFDQLFMGHKQRQY